jgi:SPP1 gp7 family putative phage head morphogenesis protein
MSISDDIANGLIRHDADTLRFTQGQVDRAIDLLTDLERELIRELKSVDPTGPTRTAYQQKRLERLLVNTRRMISRAYRDLNVVSTGEMAGFAQVEAEVVAEAVNAAIGAQVMTDSPSFGILRNMVDEVLIEGATNKDWWKRSAGMIDDRFRDQMRLGTMRGETVRELTTRIRQNVTPLSKRAAETQVRTLVNSVNNGAAMESFKANEDVVDGVQALSTFDKRTSDICISRGGGAWNLKTGKPLPQSPVKINYPGEPPWHFNCRTRLIPIVAPPPWLKGAEKKKFLDNQLAQDVNYEKWLKRQKVSTQKEILGKGRHKLWSEGKISTTQLTNAKGRTLALSPSRPKGYQPRKTLAEAEEWARKNGAQVLPKTVDEMVEAKVRGILVDEPKIFDFITEEEFRKNWRRDFAATSKWQERAYEAKGNALKVSDADRLTVQNAINMNHKNGLFRKYTDALGEPVAILQKAPKMLNTAEYVGGTAHVFSGYVKHRIQREVPKAGITTISSAEGMQGTLRHEYGHGLWRKTSKDFQERWKTFYRGKTKAVLRDELTHLADMNHEEAFAEVFAAMTSTRWNPENFPKWVQEAAEDIELELLKK